MSSSVMHHWHGLGSRPMREGLDVDTVVDRAARAQRSFAGWSERRVDRLLAALAHAAVQHAGDLARRTVEETGMGCAEDKSRKNVFAATGVLRSVVGRAGCGVLGVDRGRGITEVARPVGVVLGLMPVTNPVATLVSTTLIALKSRNALVVRPHPRAAGVSGRAADLLRAVLASTGAPVDLVQAVVPTDRTQVASLLRHPGIDLVLATGSTGLVRAAAASGKPTLGAGSGNAPAWICADADAAAAARTVVTSKAFDHGIICGSEQHLLADFEVLWTVVAALNSAGAVVLAPWEVECLADVLFAEGRVRTDVIGRSAPELARRAGIRTADGVRLLVAPLPDGASPHWDRERLVPVLTLRGVAGEPAALRICADLLRQGGAGHTAAIHTRSRARALAFAEALPVSRVIVNGPASQGCIGLGTGLTPSLTLGCGPAGGAVTTDNITYRHLQQIGRVARPTGTRLADRLRRRLLPAG